MCGCLLCTPSGEPGLHPRRAPRLGTKPVSTVGDDAHPTEPSWPGPRDFLTNKPINCAGNSVQTSLPSAIQTRTTLTDLSL